MAEMQRYAVVVGGRIVRIIRQDPSLGPPTAPIGAVVMLEAEAIAQGYLSSDGVDDTRRAEQAINKALRAATRAATIAGNADDLANASGSMTNAQLTQAVRQLANWVGALARFEVMSNRQRVALILHHMVDFDPIGSEPEAVTVSPTPTPALATGAPLAPVLLAAPKETR
jgi:hypothetical protein